MLRHNSKSRDARGTIDLEIPAIDGEDAIDSLAFGDPHQSGVRQVHRQVVVLQHQLANARHIVAIEGGDLDGSVWIQLQQRRLGAIHVRQEMTRFGDRRPNRDERSIEFLKRASG